MQKKEFVKEMFDMLKIVLTGGPCSGKTVASGVLIQLLEARGFKVFTPPEQASIFILNGICPSDKISMEEFQNFIIDGQIATENLFRKAAEYYDPDKVMESIWARGRDNARTPMQWTAGENAGFTTSTSMVSGWKSTVSNGSISA